MNPELFININKNLDSHISLRLIEEHEKDQVFASAFLQKEKLAALLQTRLFEKLKATASQLKLSNLEKKISELESSTTSDINEINNNKDLKKFLDSVEKKKQYSKNYIQSLGYSPEFLIPLSKLAKIQYDQGKYAEAHKLLSILFPQFEDNQQLTLNLILGKLNCEIMLNNLDDARETIRMMKNKLEDDDKNKYTGQNYHMLVNHRVHFLHAALVLFVKLGNGSTDIDAFLELIMSEKMLGTVQMVCPYFVRYIAIAIFSSKQYQMNGEIDIRKFIKLLKSSIINYSDCWTQYLKQVQSDFDFVESKKTIQILAQDTKNDIFMRKNADQLIEHAKNLFFENYCRLYTQVTIQNVAEFLGCDLEKAEIWIVNLIRNANIEAKIDSDKGLIQITRNPQNFTEKIALKTKELLPKTKLQVQNLQKLI